MRPSIDARVLKTCRECEELGATHWTVAELYDALSKADKQADLKQEALKVLERLQPDVARSYSSYSNLKVRRSDQKLDSFDREKITNSLVVETHLPRGMSEKIAREIEQELKNFNVATASSLLIRELVSTKLLEYGFEKAQVQYTRLGLPVYDVSRLLESKPPRGVRDTIADSVLSQYALTNVLPHEVVDSYLLGDIYINTLSDFPTKALTYSKTLPKKADAALISAVISELKSLAVSPVLELGSAEGVGRVSDELSLCAPLNSVEQLKASGAGSVKVRMSRDDVRKTSPGLDCYALNDSQNLMALPFEGFMFTFEKENGVFEKVDLNLSKLAFESRVESRFLEALRLKARLAVKAVESKSECFVSDNSLPSVLGLHDLLAASALVSGSFEDAGGVAGGVFDALRGELSGDWLVSLSDDCSFSSTKFGEANQGFSSALPKPSFKERLEFVSSFGKKFNAGYSLTVSSQAELKKAFDEGVVQARLSF